MATPVSRPGGSREGFPRAHVGGSSPGEFTTCGQKKGSIFQSPIQMEAAGLCSPVIGRRVTVSENLSNPGAPKFECRYCLPGMPERGRPLWVNVREVSLSYDQTVSQRNEADLPGHLPPQLLFLAGDPLLLLLWIADQSSSLRMTRGRGLPLSRTATLKGVSSGYGGCSD